MKSFMKFIRENPTLAFGLGLPLLLVAVFLAAAKVPEIGMEPPKYDLVFATNYNPNPYGQAGLIIRVENKKASAAFIGENPYYIPPRIYIYEAARNALREIPVLLPQEVKMKAQAGSKDRGKVTAVSIPELEALSLDNHTVSPDGFEFSPYDNGYPHDLLGNLFFGGGNYRNSAALKKGSYTLRLPQTENIYGANVHFIGWVIPQ